MTRLRGRSLKGTRLVEHVPHGHWKTTTFLFLAWVQQHLIKELRPGDIVIMDNLSSHKVKGVAEALESVGASARFLPPYSPDLNPIEMAFAKLKQLIRSAKQRTIESLWNTCGKVLDRFTETDFRNFIRHAGYRYNLR